MKKSEYERHLAPMLLELNNLARWLAATGRRLVVVLEGRDTAGKGGTITTISGKLNPRQVRVVALPTPDPRERTQWYFQRYIAHLPAAGEWVLFDRSWYNRAGVERVMGFCTEAECAQFLREVPFFEQSLVNSGILLFKYWLAVDQEEQEARFAERARNPLKRWKLSAVDLAARDQYRAYGAARDAMFAATHRDFAPWVAVNYNDQRRGRLTLIRHLLDNVPDYRLPEKPMELPPLQKKLARERFRGPVRPIKMAF
ncbi:MAG TPA: polyphosphate kinase 2 [Gammaproteobacteria bacterium]|jgi:polyphosphate kinase 2|uniref:polyphosphate kinase 2 n=1 Tax=Immundisolibacter sp. TaxID=1934948 RepID=UPI000E8D3679|nr:polyphosphate kinase 2 [Gammaproteobacteria bacterium]HCZ47760.1 polyphosphate kinase 2 [Gammaproteobacteria bacterium]MCH77198.1 polyphosphate kinase 2 [Gammaproteobacteria bacterium]